MTAKQSVVSPYSQREMRQVAAVIRKLGPEAVKDASETVSKLSKFMLFKIQQTAARRGEQEQRIADKGRAKVNSLIAEIGLGYARTRFSGGGNGLWNFSEDGGPGLLAGLEFGTKGKYPQFPPSAGRAPSGRGGKGRFIYPTLRAVQPSIVEAWEEVSINVLERWSRGSR